MQGILLTAAALLLALRGVCCLMPGPEERFCALIINAPYVAASLIFVALALGPSRSHRP